MEKKQSSIEWLEWQINLGLSERGLISAFKEAKAMHKEEVQDAYRISPNNELWSNSGIDYYNETFEVTMSNKEQSSIEWLENQLKERYSLMNSEPLFEQAKEMENSQKKEMYVKGLKNYDPTYLNKIYGGNNLEVTISNNKHECCTPKGKVPRYVDCVGCDKKPIEGATLSYAEAQKDSFNIMEKKQSSIEWYANASHELIVKKSNGEITEREFLTMHHNLFYDAEAMHKEEIVESHHEGYYSFSHSGEQYYNETFGGSE